MFHLIIYAIVVTCLKSCIKLRKAFALFHCFLRKGLLRDLDRERDGFLLYCLEVKYESIFFKYIIDYHEGKIIVINYVGKNNMKTWIFKI